MSVRNCAFPWHWLIVTADGDVMPCSHGSRPVGNLRCVMCPQGMREVRRPEHTPLAFAAGVRGFLRRAQRVILSGVGEPLLAPAFWDVVEGLRDKAFGLLRIHTP